MRRSLLVLVLLAWAPSLWNPVRGQAPGVGEKSASNKKQNPPLAQAQPETDRRGTKDAPLVIDPKGHIDTPEETAKSKADEDRKATVEGWTVASAVAVALFTAILVIVGWRGVNAANRTLREINRQADLMEQQLTESRATTAEQAAAVQASIAEAVRSATAMEGVAVSMASNVESVRESVAISKEIATTQKIATELQSRAYLSVFLDKGFYQDANHVFEIEAVIKNHGNTPAYAVSFLATLDIIPIPIPEDFTYPLTEANAGASVSLMAPGTTKLITRLIPKRIPASEVEGIKRGGPPKALAMWGVVNYLDAFDKPRFVNFAFTLYWQPWLPGMEKDKNGVLKDEPMYSRDTRSHNDAN